MRQFNLALNINAKAAAAIALAMNECTFFQTPLERTDRVLAALASADLIIVSKPVGNADAVREAVRTGNWAAVSERDLLAWCDAPREEEVAPAAAAEQYPPAWSETEVFVVGAGQSGFLPEGVTLVPGNVMTLPPGTEIRSADTAAPEPERDNWGLRADIADDLAARYGCRVTLAGMDDADNPLTDEGIVGDPHYVVVTERATGRHVALVEAWETEDGDPIVPKHWLEVVLSAWDAARDPQRAA